MHQYDDHKPFFLKYRYEFLLLALFLTIYIIPLGARPLMVPDETRYAEIPREMLVSGDWTVPRLNGLRYFEKPVLGYWIHAGAQALCGENNFSVRLPSALAVGLSALLLYLLLRRQRSGAKDQENDYKAAPPALLVTLIFLTSAEVFGVGHTAVLDNLLALFLTATIIAFYLATEAAPGSRREKVMLLLSGAACGLAFLNKGFLAFAVPVLTLSAYLIWERRYRDLWRMSWLPLLTATAVALPWCILIHLREPDFWNFFFWNEHIRRFLSTHAQHKEPFYYYLVVAPGLMLPWIMVTPPALAGVYAGWRQPEASGRLLRLAICWFGLPFLFFSCASGKLLTYILPCFPPFAILMGLGLPKALELKPWQRFFSWGAGANLLLFSLLLLGFATLEICNFNNLRPYTHPGQVLLAIAALSLAAGLSWGAFKSRSQTRRIVLLGLAPGLLFFSAGFLLPNQTLTVKAPGPLLERHLQESRPDSLIIAGSSSFRAACWYLKREDIYLLGSRGELEYGLTYPDASGRLLTLPGVAELIRLNPGKVIPFARKKKVKAWSKQLPPPVSQDSNGNTGYALWRF